MCDGSITTMLSNQSSLRYCWIVYCTICYHFNAFLSKILFLWGVKINFLLFQFIFSANSQSNETLTATESRSTVIPSTPTNSRNLTGNILSSINTTNFKKPPKTPKESNNERENDEQETDDEKSTIDDDDLASVHLMLEPHLRPPAPDQNSDLSKQIFDEHRQLAKEYLKVSRTLADVILALYFICCFFYVDSYRNRLCYETPR